MKTSMNIDGIKIFKTFDSKEECDQWKKDMAVKHSDPSLSGEIWKIIPNFSKYEASNLGRVRSMNYKKSGRIKVLKPSDTGNKGYLKTMLMRDDVRYNTRPIHRLVAAAFLGEYPELTVNHKDGNKTNNHIDNLEWMTRSENCKHACDNGLWPGTNGAKNGMAKLTESQVRCARKMKKEGGMFWGRRKLAKEWGISEKHLQRIVNKPETTWKNV